MAVGYKVWKKIRKLLMLIWVAWMVTLQLYMQDGLQN